MSDATHQKAFTRKWASREEVVGSLGGGGPGPPFAAMPRV